MKIDYKSNIARYVSATIDGTEIKNICTFADEYNGVATVYKLNEKGALCINPLSPDEFAMLDLHGKVEISLRDGTNQPVPEWAKAEYERIRKGEQK